VGKAGDLDASKKGRAKRELFGSRRKKKRATGESQQVSITQENYQSWVVRNVGTVWAAFVI